MITEKRKVIRFRTPFCVQCDSQGRFKGLSGVIRDISMKGISLLLDTNSDIPLESVITLYLMLPQNMLRVLGRVIWTKDVGDKKGLGISFMKIHDFQKEEIYEHIFKYFPDEITQRWWQT